MSPKTMTWAEAAVTRPRIFIHPGDVIARDGDQHTISTHRLRLLYGIRDDIDHIHVKEGRTRPLHCEPRADDIHLYPLGSGEYEKARQALPDIVLLPQYREKVRIFSTPYFTWVYFSGTDKTSTRN